MPHGLTVLDFSVMQCIMKAISLIFAHVKRVMVGMVELPAVLV